MERLLRIQQKLKAPKGQRNSFGKYNYRSCEDILEAVKPHLEEEGLVLTLADDIQEFGRVVIHEGDNKYKEYPRLFVRAIATLKDNEKVVAQTSALAELELNKKGMDASQITGTASSYARKYALNGLFAIDNTKDADTDEYQQKTAKSKPQAPSVNVLKAQIKTAGLEEHLSDILAEYNVAELKDLTEEQRMEFGNRLAITIKQKGAK